MTILAFTDEQIDKTSDLFLTLAKGLFLTAFVTPMVTSVDFLFLLKLLVGGMICLFSSLKILETKKEK